MKGINGTNNDGTSGDLRSLLLPHVRVKQSHMIFLVISCIYVFIYIFMIHMPLSKLAVRFNF